MNSFTCKIDDSPSWSQLLLLWLVNNTSAWHLSWFRTMLDCIKSRRSTTKWPSDANTKSIINGLFILCTYNQRETKNLWQKYIILMYRKEILWIDNFVGVDIGDNIRDPHLFNPVMDWENVLSEAWEHARLKQSYIFWWPGILTPIICGNQYS